ncbi:MAG: hypothetical protein HY223_05340 [Thaumarchaeota archaeon]|nr:hypothetical protein [Nitrososphaerota archaeon]
MSWIEDFTVFKHDMFLVFIECKIDNRGNWQRADSPQTRIPYEVLRALDGSENNVVQIIEPDGLRRTFHVSQGATISLNQNVLSYQSGRLEEITIDEKAQSGKGKTRDILQ